MNQDTYRAAYLPAQPGSTGGGTVLTLPEHADLDDAALLAAAAAILPEVNDDLAAIGQPAVTIVDVVIGTWKE